MKLKSISSAVLVAAIGMSVMAVQAAEKKGANKGAPVAATTSSAAVDSLATAAALVRYGDAKKDPVALIAAARIMADAGATQSKAERTSGKAGDAKNKSPVASTEAVLARAKALAGDRADLIALADDVAKASSRGGVNGPGRARTVVTRGAVDNFRVTFRGGEPARVLVSGDGDSDLDLYVYDENGNLICRDIDRTDDMICGWTPRYTGPFTIRVKNLGMANEYVIVHN